MGPTAEPRRGRPPASAAGDTRQRIIAVATELFSDLGYEFTTNKDVADLAGISTGALYYYFESKLDMYLAVFREQQALVDARMQLVMDTETTFHDRLCAILREAHDLNLAFPYLARFQSTARVDRQRHPELRKAIPHPPAEGAGLMGRLISDGIGTGEIDPQRRDMVEAAVRVIFVGLVHSAAAGPVAHQLGVDGMTALIDGELVSPAGPAAGTDRGRDGP